MASSGQLQTKAALNYEAKNGYSVTVTATDTAQATDTIAITIVVTDVNDSPPNRGGGGSPTPTPAVLELDVSFGQAAYSVNEGGTVSITVTVSPDADRALEIPITVTRGSAEAGDYEVSGLSNGKLSFASGDRSASFTITTVDDPDRDSETFTLEVWPETPILPKPSFS